MTIKKLNRRQIKWTEIFADFDFVIFYQAEIVHAKTNSLTRRLSNKSIFENNDRQKHQLQTILTSDKLNARIKKNLSELYFSEIAEISKNSNESINFYISTKKSEFESTKHELSQKLFIFKNKRLSIINKNAQSARDRLFKHQKNHANAAEIFSMIENAIERESIHSKLSCL